MKFLSSVVHTFCIPCNTLRSLSAAIALTISISGAAMAQMPAVPDHETHPRQLDLTLEDPESGYFTLSLSWLANAATTDIPSARIWLVATNSADETFAHLLYTLNIEHNESGQYLIDDNAIEQNPSGMTIYHNGSDIPFFPGLSPGYHRLYAVLESTAVTPAISIFSNPVGFIVE